MALGQISRVCLIWVGLFCVIWEVVNSNLTSGVNEDRFSIPISDTIGKLIKKRQALEGGCKLPSPCKNGKYKPSENRCQPGDNTPACQMVPGSDVISDWVILLEYCDDGYVMNTTNKAAVCSKGRWIPKLPTCVAGEQRPGGDDHSGERLWTSDENGGNDLKSLGCFKDSGQRLLAGHRQNFPGKLTNMKCVQHCTLKGFRYAGTENGHECFCGNAEPIRNLLEDPQECNMKCPGDPGEMCGGVWRLAVFATNSENAEHVLRPLGCFKDAGSRLLAAHRQNFPNVMTNRMCVEHCARKEFKYAGTENGHECFCGNLKPRTHLLESPDTCNKPCPGNREETCGGTWRLAVYATNITEPDNSH